MADDESESSGDIFDRITKRFTWIGGIVGAVVALNTSISGCSNDNIQRYDNFRSAVDHEEKYWRDLYTEYLGTFDAVDEKEGDKAKLRNQAKIAAIQALTNHSVPDFREHQLGLFWNTTRPQDQAQNNIAEIKRSLVDALSHSSDETVAKTTQAAIFAADEATIVSQAAKVASSAGTVAVAPSPPPIVQPVVQTGSVISYQSQTLSLGDKKGWDIDMFWCAGATESDNYLKGIVAAQKLAAAANATGSKTANGLLLGRIRLRSLPAEKQGKNGYPASGFQIRTDNNAAERTAAIQLRDYLNDIQPTKFTIAPSIQQSRFYLSLFICS